MKLAKLMHVEPVGKPRMTRRDKWAQRECVLQYRDFCDAVRAAAGPYELPDSDILIVFHISMPMSWSTKKKISFAGTPHRAKPDLDNCLKALLDAMRDDDSTIWHLSAVKRWSFEGSIEIYETQTIPEAA